MASSILQTRTNGLATREPVKKDRRGERRPSLRPRFAIQVRVDVQQPFEPDYVAHGTSLNLTHNGVRLEVDRKIIRGARCVVRFRHCEGRIVPNPVLATVRNVTRCRTGAHGRYEVGLEFDQPLEKLKRPGED